MNLPLGFPVNFGREKLVDQPMNLCALSLSASLRESKTTTRAATDGKHAAPWRKEVRSDKAIDQVLPDRQVETLLDGGVPFCFSWDSSYLFLLLMSNIHN